MMKASEIVALNNIGTTARTRISPGHVPNGQQRPLSGRKKKSILCKSTSAYKYGRIVRM